MDPSLWISALESLQSSRNYELAISFDKLGQVKTRRTRSLSTPAQLFLDQHFLREVCF